MSNSIPFVFIAVVLLCMSGYYFYKSWFDLENLRNSLVQRHEKNPKWYPLREYMLRFIKKGSWGIYIRLMSTTFVMLSLFLLVYSVVLFFR